MTALSQLSNRELEDFRNDVQAKLSMQTANRMSLDLTRGKPARDQTALSDELEEQINGNFLAADGTDTRNYGGLWGLAEARELGAKLIDCPASQVIAGGNSSLTLMHLVMDTANRFGLHAGMRPWQESTDAQGSAKVLAPVPGYDRHFALTEALGIGMDTVPMTDTGPDMEAVHKAVQDPSVKGIWCVPKYSNPTGCVYDDATVAAIAQLPKIAAADNFVVLWDNAYSVHDFQYPATKLASLSAAAELAGTSDHMAQFASTSKITFAGAGVSFVAGSDPMLAQLEKRLSVMTIGFDKVNQLKHARFLNHRLDEHMRKHAELLRPKFELVEKKLSAALGHLDIAQWTHPKGGYFVSLDVKPGLASTIVEMAGNVGLALTAAGATYPYGNDPDNRNIRIAPTFADLDSLEAAMDVLVLCVQLASADQQIMERQL